MSQAMAIGKAGKAEEPFGAAPHERPVPRISIAAFCEFPDTGAALQRASSDRRLAKAHVDVQLGGLQGAIDHFSGHVTPNLLIIETKLQGKAAVEDVDRLADVCDPATKVVVIGRINDVELYRELTRRGVSEYLVAPVDPLHLIETISGLYGDRETQPIGRVIAFVSARGGAGSSTLAHNVGWCIAEQLKIHTTIIDFDLPFGTLALDFNEDPTQSVADALGAPERLDDVFLDRVLVKVSDRLSLFPSPTMLERGYDADPVAYEAVVDAVRQMSPCVIVDLPHLWSPWVRQTLLAADDVVIVAAPCLGSLRNGKAFMDLLKQHRPNDAPPRLVLNQVGIPKRPEIPAREFASAIGVDPAVTVPFEPQLFGASANHGQMLAELHPKSHAAHSMLQLAEIVTGRRPQENSQKSVLPFLSLLSGRKSA
ncbi:MAG TPA: pilus assembly protein CpaE [Rhizomicrobium sp.]|jgi:pilus assembly protein CpaE|nr:pilus assembly protein CpaE [Rhizomicrobium sp.]